MAKRISVINFKGGVGKTTLAFNLGAGLALRHEARVLLVDMDHQGSLSVLCLTAGGWQKAIDERRLIDEIFPQFYGKGPGLPGDEIIIPSPLKDRDVRYNKLDIVPASLELDDIEIALTASHQGDAITSEWNKRTMVCRWIEEAAIDDRYDYIIFDCPPATKIVSQNAIAASHGYIIPVVPETLMARGTVHLRGMIRAGIDGRLGRLRALQECGATRKAYVQDTALIGLVVTRIQGGAGPEGLTIEHGQGLDSLAEEWQEDLLFPYVKQGIGMARQLRLGRPVFTRPDRQNIVYSGILGQYEELVDEIRCKIDEKCQEEA